MCEAYGKGIVRAQVENTNLRANHKENDVTHSETFRTCQTESFYGRGYVDLVELLNDKRQPERKAVFGEIDARAKKKKKLEEETAQALSAMNRKNIIIFVLIILIS